jgi:hypothetical protein
LRHSAVATALQLNCRLPKEQIILAELIRKGRATRIGLIRQELLSGIKTVAQFEKPRDVLRAFPDEPITTGDHEAAAKASND